MKKSYVRTRLYMDTSVSIKIIADETNDSTVFQSMDQAFSMFQRIEQIGSRFDSNSEVMTLLNHVGEVKEISTLLFTMINYSIEMAILTNGLFDPTIGFQLESLGFNKNYLTKKRIQTSISENLQVSYKDIVLDVNKKTILLKKPLILDLGAIAKGFAIDLAVKVLDLYKYNGFLIDAGGDIFARGTNIQNEQWKVGIRHPIHTEETISTISLSNQAVCTSGNYERVSNHSKEIHHIFNPTIHNSANEVASCTVIAPFALLADSFSTAAFILGPQKGIDLLAEQELHGIIWTPDLKEFYTQKRREKN